MKSLYWSRALGCLCLYKLSRQVPFCQHVILLLCYLFDMGHESLLLLQSTKDYILQIMPSRFCNSGTFPCIKGLINVMWIMQSITLPAVPVQFATRIVVCIVPFLQGNRKML